MVTFLDFFSGIGNFRLGMEQAGHKCVGFCEIDKFAVISYTSMHLITDEQRAYLESLPMRQRQKEILKEEYRNGEWYADDITRVCARDLPRADIWCFGAPCTSFSVAGKRAGLDGESGLIRQIFRLLDELPEEDRPEWLIYENVKGMFSSNRGWDYAAILTEMDRGGYDIEWQNINSAWFVPQNRERIYTVGHNRRCGSCKIFPIEGTSRENHIQIIGHRNGYRRNMQTFCEDGISEALDTGAGGGRGHHVAVPIQCCRTKGIVGESNYSHTLMARDYKGIGNQEMTAIAILVLTPDRAEKRQNGRRFKENGEPMFTLTAQDRHGVAIPVKEATQEGYALAHEGDSINLLMPNSKIRRGRVGHGVAQTLDTSCNQGVMVRLESGTDVYAIWSEEYQCYIAIRRLTPRECFRLQGVPDEYFDRAAFVNSDSQLFKQAGNSVTVPVIKAIGEKIKNGSEI